MGRVLLAVCIALAVGLGGWRAIGLVTGDDGEGVPRVAEAGDVAAGDAALAVAATRPAETRAPDAPEAARLRSLLADSDARRAVAEAMALAGDRLAVPVVAVAASEAAHALAAEAGAGPADRLARADAARRLLGRLIVAGASRDSRDETVLDALNREVLHAGRAVPGTTERLEVPPGATLDRLLRGAWKDRVHVTAGFLLHVNGIPSAQRLRPGPLTVPVERVRVLVDKGEYSLRVLLGEVPYRKFPVGLGARGRTPEGRFVIEERLVKPDYWPPGGSRVPFGAPGNPLGTRWLGFQDRPDAQGFGIHGTDEPSSIGKDLSQGCVRMLNADVETVFEWIGVGVEVEIRPRAPYRNR